MVSGNVWGSENKVFGDGREGEILLNVGGNLQTKNEDEIGFAEHGLVIRHNDPADTITLIPWENIRMIRTNLTSSARRDRERRALEAAERKRHPTAIDLGVQVVKELHE